MGLHDRASKEPERHSTAVRLRATVVQVPVAYRDITLLETLPATMWRDVLAAAAVDTPDVSDDELVPALFRLLDEPQPNALIDALQTIAEVGTSQGAEVIQELEREIGAVVPPELGQVVTTQEHAARLWCIGREDARIAERLAVAQSLLLARQRTRPALRFAGKSVRRPRPAAVALPILRKHLVEALTRRGAGTYLSLDQVPDEDRIRLYVVHGTPRRSVITVNEAETARERKELRPAVGDIVEYDIETARLDLHLASAHLAKDYRRALGIAFFNDSEFFSGNGGWTLVPLQKRRGAVLTEAPFARIERATLRSCIWCPSPGQRITLSADDVFDLVRANALRLEDGEIVEARLAIRLRGGGRHQRVIATIRPPDQLVCDPRHVATVSEYLLAIGLGTGTVVTDLWRVGSGTHTEAAWRAVLGPDGVDAARRARVIVEAQLPAPPSDASNESATVDDVDDAGSAVQIEHDGRVALVPSEQRRGYRLDATVLASTLSTFLGIREAPAETHPGLVELGTVAVGENRVSVVVAYRDPGLREEALRDVLGANVRSTVVLVPAGRTLSGVPVAPLDHFLAPTRLLGRIASALRLEASLPAIEIAPRGSRLVVDRDREKVWLDELELDLTPTQFAFVAQCAIATLRNSATTSRPSGRASARGQKGDGAAKKTKSELLKRIKRCFANAGRAMPAELAAADGLLRSQGYGWNYTFVPAVATFMSPSRPVAGPETVTN